MEIFKETEIKYLAGLLDADGCLGFKFTKTATGKTYVGLVMALTASKRIDRQGYLYTLGERLGSCCEITYAKDTYSDAVKWNVQSRADLNKIIPRLLKHMVVKATYWKWLFDTYTEYQGRDVTELVDQLKEEAKTRRTSSGPLHEKVHPTWAWVAGYLDGDGCYTMSKKAVHISVITHKDDLDGVKLLQKAFGGSIYDPRPDNTVLWRRGAGKANRSFAIKFLSKMAQHSRLKKYKIEKMLNFHNQSQRLTDVTPTGEVIV